MLKKDAGHSLRATPKSSHPVNDPLGHASDRWIGHADDLPCHTLDLEAGTGTWRLLQAAQAVAATVQDGEVEIWGQG